MGKKEVEMSRAEFLAYVKIGLGLEEGVDKEKKNPASERMPEPFQSPAKRAMKAIGPPP
jgi:hypothetical protein